MDYETQISEKQLEELCKYYENKSEHARHLIRENLTERQKIKAKIVEEKERAASLLQVLERLDEYEKVVRNQLEAGEKMENPESLKKLEIIKKYESMVRQQREVWAKYEEEYEQLPMARERQKVQLQLLKTSIQVKLLNYKIEEKKKMINLKLQISKRKDQIAIIKFAEFMVNYKNREKHYYELRGKVNALKEKEQELRREIQQLEQLNINRENKINAIEKQPCIKSLSLPPMDLSRFIVSHEKDNDNTMNADKVSMYSFKLEQEYMNTEDVDQHLSKASTQPSNMDESNSQNNEESQETNAETLIDTETLMDINTEEFSTEINQENVAPRSNKKDHSNVHKGESSKKSSQESVKKSGRNASKKRASQNRVSEDYTNSENVRDEQRNVGTSIERPVPTPAKMPKHVQVREDYSNYKNTHDPTNIHSVSKGAPCSPKVAAKVQDWQRASSPKPQKINREPQRQQHQQQQHQLHQSQYQFQQQKSQQQQYHQEQQQQRHHQQQRQPPQQQQHQQLQAQQQQQQRQPLQQQQHQQLQAQQQQQQRQPLQQQQQRQPPQQQQQRQQQQPLNEQQPLQQQHQQQQMSWSPNLHQNTTAQNLKRDLTGLPQSNKPQVKSNESVHIDTQRFFQKQQMSHETMKQPADMAMDISYDESETLDAPPQMIQQSCSTSNQNKSSANVQLVTPQYRSINADSMMSANMYSSDTNMSGDNISAIIGSDITEPGGAVGLVRHLYGESDDISEDVDIDFDNIMSKFCSPLQQENSKLQQQPIHDRNNQHSVHFNEAVTNHDPQEHTNRNFAVAPFQQKSQKNSSHRLF